MMTSRHQNNLLFKDYNLLFNQKKLTRKICPKLIAKLQHARSPSTTSQKNVYIRDISKPTRQLTERNNQFFRNTNGSNIFPQLQNSRIKSQLKLIEKNVKENLICTKCFVQSEKFNKLITEDQQNITLSLLKENEQLRKKNLELNLRIKKLQETKSKDNQSYDLKQLHDQISLLKSENNTIKLKLSDQKLLAQKPDTYAFLREYSQENDHLIKTIKDQNRKLKQQIEYLRNSVYNDVQSFKKNNNKELVLVKEKYMKLLQNYQQLSKDHCGITLKMKRILLQIQSGKYSTLKAHLIE